MDESEVIRAFVNHLGKERGCSKLAVDRWPDKENRNSPDIDAIAGPYAIEHTSIDTVANQRQADDWYLRVVEGLDQVIADRVDCGFTIILEYDAIAKGMDWNCVRNDLRRWIATNASGLAHGNHQIVLPMSTPVECPIVMRVWKGQSRRIGFSRYEPQDDTLATRVGYLLHRKASKLVQYQTPNTTTVLLVENDDIALMNYLKLLDAIREAYPDGPPEGVDEIWFADTSISDKPEYRDFTAMLEANPHASS